MNKLLADSRRGSNLLQSLKSIDNFTLPIEDLNLKLEVLGVYSFPEEWNSIDDQKEAQGLFQYIIKFQGQQIQKGKIYPRQKSEQELREEEEAANAKNKKAGKKDNKKGGKDEDIPQFTQEELNQQRLLQQQKEEQERLFWEEWNKLDEQTKFYRTKEDIYKCGSIQWEEKQITEIKKDKELVIFKERVFNDSGDWIYLVKTTTKTDDEMEKLKKSKPKTLNLNDLNTLVYRAWIDLTQLKDIGVNKIQQRCHFQQVIIPGYEIPGTEIPKPQLDNMYVNLKLTLNQNLVSQKSQNQLTLQDLIPKIQVVQKQTPEEICITEFDENLKIIVESLAIEFSNMFGVELNKAQENKSKQSVMGLQRKNDMNKRKELFLYDFNVTGKYKILKERVKKSIVKICRDKFQKTGSFTGITTDQKDQFYSELYVFLIEQMRNTISKMVKQKKEELHDNIVISFDQTLKERDQLINNVTQETKSEILSKLATEFELLNNYDFAALQFDELLKIDSKNHVNLYQYIRFQLRNKASQVKIDDLIQKQQEALKYAPENNNYKLSLAILFMKAKKFKEPIVILQDMLNSDPQNSLYNVLLFIIYEFIMKRSQISSQYMAICQRILLRKEKILPPIGVFKDEPILSELPQIKQIVPEGQSQNKYLITDDQNDEIIFELISYLLDNYFFDLAATYMKLIKNQESQRAKLYESRILIYENLYDRALNILNLVLEQNPKNYNILIQKGLILYKQGKYEECIQTYFKALRLSTNKNENFQTFLRLGDIYIRQQKYGDAKAISTKVCELRPDSPLGWAGLGISSLYCESYQDAEIALTQANIYDPNSPNVWGALVLLCFLNGNKFYKAKQAFREFMKTNITSQQENILDQIGDYFLQNQDHQSAQICYNRIIQTPSQNAKLIGQVNFKLGNLYRDLNQQSKAREHYEQAQDFTDDQDYRDQIQQILDMIRDDDQY